MSEVIRWAEPSDAQPGLPVLEDAQVESWRTRGFTLVDGVFPTELLEQARDDAIRHFPKVGSAEAEKIDDFGGMGQMEFPSKSAAANAMTLHPRMLSAVAQLLQVRTHDLRLTQSNLWPKYGRLPGASGKYDHSDQRIHVDYPNHTLTHPPRWDSPEAVELIVYLSEVETCGGATALVPRNGDSDPAYPWPIMGTPSVGGVEWINDREAAESHLREHAPEVARWREKHLYAREARARYRVGSVLLYRHDTWHRGTPLQPGSMRLAMNLTYRKADAEWLSIVQTGWAWAMYRRSAVMEQTIATSSVEQRCVLGFPEPGHPYWNADTIAAVRARFEAWGIDMSPYQAALR